MLEATPAADGGSSDADVVFRGAVAVDYAQFALRDRAYRPILTLGSLAGLVTVRPCELVLVTGTQTGRVGCTVVVAGHDPGAGLDAYEDVEEASFASPTGVVSLVERGADRPATEIDLGAGAATPPVPEGVGRGASAAGRAHVTEALPADVASTYWSHLLLRPGDHVRSRRAWLVFRSDGNLVVCDENARVRWMSGTAGQGVQAVFQIDGNLAVYDGEGQVVWASGTHGYEGNFLAVQDDGNVVVYRADGSALWATGTGH